jgi:hypothetical protein
VAFRQERDRGPHRYAEDLLDDRGLRIIGNLFVPVVLPSFAIPAVAACASLGGTYGFAAGCHVLPLDLTNAQHRITSTDAIAAGVTSTDGALAG